MLTRRELLSRTILASAAVVPLYGCANGIVATVAQDANLIASGLEGALSSIGSLNISGLTADKIQTIGLAIASLKTVAGALAGAASNSAAQPLVQQIETDLNAIVGALASLPLPPQISIALQAAAILLPIIEAGIGMILPAPTTPTARLAAGVAMTPDQARLILKGAAK